MLSDAAFTHGPWGIEEFQNGAIYVGPVRPSGTLGDIIVSFDDRGDYKPEVQARIKANANLIAAAPDMFAKLERAAFIFRTYAELHRAKKTDEGDAKAASNEVLAEEMETVLSKARGETA